MISPLLFEVFPALDRGEKGAWEPPCIWQLLRGVITGDLELPLGTHAGGHDRLSQHDSDAGNVRDDCGRIEYSCGTTSLPNNTVEIVPASTERWNVAHGREQSSVVSLSVSAP